MENIWQYNKTIVSIIMALLMLTEQWTGWSLSGISEEWVTSILAVIWPILVLLVPNQTE